MTDSTLRDTIAATARTVPLRLGNNALRLANEGERVCLSGSEADNLTDALMPLLTEALAEAWDNGHAAAESYWSGRRLYRPVNPYRAQRAAGGSATAGEGGRA